ncbi:MAG: glycosyl hydrolase family 8 [Fibrobacter sp.]|nr:glycosyl hydrolase family 8 [Fibrobacter sp.]
MNTTIISSLSLALLLGASATYAADNIYTAPSFFDKETGAYYGPDCDKTNYSGAYYTGDYTSPFTTVMGKTEEDIQKKLDQLWNHYFKGDDNSKVYYDQGNEAYIMDTGNNDVRSEGMSYGMMISVQTNHKEEFQKLWNYAKNHMWHRNGDEWDGYFSWQIRLAGGADNKPAPDGEMYFMMALLFAANRWNDTQYMDDAQYILDKMWNNWQYKLFNEQTYIVTFQPTQGNKDFSDPSYDLPAFLELFSRWSKKDQDKWQKTVSATRDHLYKSSHSTTGLFTDYNNFDGTPHSGFDSNNPSDTYMFDAIRCAMNFGMDYYMFGADTTREKEMAKKILDFFHKDNYSHAHFQWDGNLVNNHQNDPYTLGQKGANAVATYAVLNDPSYEEKVKKNLSLAWDGEPLTGSKRYYDGLVHFLAMLHLTGHFKIWKPMPTVEKKTVEGEYNGETFDKDTTFNAFEGCKLYELTVKPAAKPVATDTSSKIDPNQPQDSTIAIASVKAMNAAKVWANNGAIYIENAAIGSKYTITDLNGRVLTSSRTTSSTHEVRLGNTGALLVIVGNKAYKITK